MWGLDLIGTEVRVGGSFLASKGPSPGRTILNIALEPYRSELPRIPDLSASSRDGWVQAALEFVLLFGLRVSLPL
jgi:hypothetical protein